MLTVEKTHLAHCIVSIKLWWRTTKQVFPRPIYPLFSFNSCYPVVDTSFHRRNCYTVHTDVHTDKHQPCDKGVTMYGSTVGLQSDSDCEDPQPTTEDLGDGVNSTFLSRSFTPVAITYKHSYHDEETDRGGNAIVVLSSCPVCTRSIMRHLCFTSVCRINKCRNRYRLLHFTIAINIHYIYVVIF